MTTISENELAAQGIMYIARGRRKPPKGWVLAHNHVRHGKNTPQPYERIQLLLAGKS
jgi:hypothetical protein